MDDKNSFTPIPNPYIVGNPIKDRKMFFGREDDFTYIRQKITGGKTGGMIVLCGARRSGKTSILFQIKAGRLGEEFLPVLIDMQSMTMQSNRDFIDKLAQEIINGVRAHDIEYEKDYAQKAVDNPYAAFEDLIKKVNAHLAGKKLILMFDEYEIFENHIDNNYISTDILNLLANWMEHKEGVFIIFTGSDRLQARNPRYWEYFLGKALHRRISFLSRSDTLRLIREPIEGLVSYHAGIPDQLYALAAGQPFYTQVLCQTIVDHLNESRKNTVSVADVQNVINEIIENPLPHMIFAWSSLSDVEKLALSIIGEINREEVLPALPRDVLAYPAREGINFELDFNKLNEALERLFHYDLLDKDAKDEKYTFKMDLWRRWMMRMHSVWQVIDEVAGSGKEPGDGIIPIDRKRTRTRMIWLVSAIMVLVAAALFQLLFRGGGGQTGVVSSLAVWEDSTIISIRTVPSNAEIILAGQYLGYSPIIEKQVPAKKVPIMIKMDGYKTLNDTLALMKDMPLDTTFALTERTGGLAIDSYPSGARIILDGNDTGQRTRAEFTDLSVRESHRVELRMDGYQSIIIPNVQIIEDSLVTLSRNMAQQTAPLSIRSIPSVAQIIFDRKPIGNTPHVLPEVAYGTHEIELQLAGYRAVRERITIPASNNEFVRTMQKLDPGVLELRIQPYAELYINGILVNKAAVHHKKDYEVGSYEIELRHPSLGTFTFTVEVKSGETNTKDYNLYELSKKEKQ